MLKQTSLALYCDLYGVSKLSVVALPLTEVSIAVVAYSVLYLADQHRSRQPAPCFYSFRLERGDTPETHVLETATERGEKMAAERALATV